MNKGKFLISAISVVIFFLLPILCIWFNREYILTDGEKCGTVMPTFIFEIFIIALNIRIYNLFD